MKTERELVMDLSLLVARMARRLRRDGPTVHDAGDRALADQAVAYLQRHRLTSPLRDMPDCGDAGHADGRCGNAQCLPSDAGVLGTFNDQGEKP